MWRCSVLLALALSPDLRAADKPDSLRVEVAAALKRFYEERLNRPFLRNPNKPEKKPAPPPWEAPLKKLKAGKPDEREAAAAFLRELLSQALEHETSGKAPWRSTPYWGGGADVPARDLRKEVAEELAKAAPLAGSLPLIRWYLDRERVAGHLKPVVEALGKLDGKQADALRAELVTRPHPNAGVVVEALGQMTTRKSALPAERLADLCRHYRASVRAAARKLNAKLGSEEPPAFDSKLAMRSKAVRDLMDEVTALIPDLPPARAKFVRVTVRYFDKKQEKDKDEYLGWQLARDKASVTIYTPHATRETIRDGVRTQITQSERIPNGVRSWKIDVTQKVEVSPAKIEELIQQVEKANKKEGGRLGLSERGPLTGQFEGGGASLFEAVLGAWLFRAGKDAEAARVVLPAIDTLYEDRHFAEMVKSRMGNKAGYAMLVAFAGDRDYAGTLALARQIDKLYPGTRFHAYAREMAKQLPGRMEDFTKFKLPTAAEWTALKKKQTRTEEIDYLCERLRLLNCFQMGQPGGYDPDETQYAEPCGMAANASWGLNKGKTEVINPLTELVGPVNWYDKDKPRPKGLALTLADVSHLSKHLREDRYAPIVSFWRDFHPNRNLESTRPMIAGIINDLARRDLCQIGRWSGMGIKEIGKEIERINRWAKENAGRSPEQIEREALKDMVQDGASWYQVRNRVEALVKARDRFGFELLERYLASEKSDDDDRSTVLRVYLEHDVDKAKDLAPKFLTAREPELRFTAALVVFRTGDKKKTRPLLGEALAQREVDAWTTDAVVALLKDGSAESKKQAARLFANRGLAHKRGHARANCVRLCAAAGLKEPYRFYLPLLDVKETELRVKTEKGESAGASYFAEPVREVFAKEIVKVFGKEKAVAEVARKHPRTRDQVAPLKAWLQGRLNEK